MHLVAKWLSTLEKKLEQYSYDSHAKYRVFISAEPAATRESHIMPQGILEAAIKITNEPPTGMFANLHKALDNFTQVWDILRNKMFLHAFYLGKFHKFADCGIRENNDIVFWERLVNEQRYMHEFRNPQIREIFQNKYTNI